MRYCRSSFCRSPDMSRIFLSVDFARLFRFVSCIGIITHRLFKATSFGSSVQQHSSDQESADSKENRNPKRPISQDWYLNQCVVVSGTADIPHVRPNHAYAQGSESIKRLEEPDAHELRMTR